MIYHYAVLWVDNDGDDRETYFSDDGYENALAFSKYLEDAEMGVDIDICKRWGDIPDEPTS